MQRLMIVRDGAQFTAFGQTHNVTAGHELTVNDGIANQLIAKGVAVPAVPLDERPGYTSMRGGLAVRPID